LGGKKLSAVNAQACAAYVKHRGKQGGTRRDLETFRAAINHHAKEGFHRSARVPATQGQGARPLANTQGSGSTRQENYGHHHPDFQEEAAEAFGGRRS